jgi:hypothetical protein
MRNGDIEVNVLIDGEAATEYDDRNFKPTEGRKETSSYIQGVPGANFAIRCTLHQSYKFALGVDYLSVHYTIDGQSVTSYAIPKDQFSGERPLVAERSGFITRVHGKYMEEKFRFGERTTFGKAYAPRVLLDLTRLQQDEVLTAHEIELLAKEADAQGLGVLKVTVWRYRGKRGKMMLPETPVHELEKPVHEKVVQKKGLRFGTM